MRKEPLPKKINTYTYTHIRERSRESGEWNDTHHAALGTQLPHMSPLPNAGPCTPSPRWHLHFRQIVQYGK